ALAYIVIAWALLSKRDPIFGGKSSADWAEALKRTPEFAMRGLQAGDAEAVRVLTEILEGPDSVAANYAAQVFYRLGPRADVAVPALTAALENPDLSVRYWVTRALGSMGRRRERPSQRSAKS